MEAAADRATQATSYRLRSNLADGESMLPPLDRREFGSGTSNTAVAIMPYSRLDSLSRAGLVSGLSLPEDARSVYMGGHGTTQTVAAVIIRLRPLGERRFEHARVLGLAGGV